MCKTDLFHKHTQAVVRSTRRHTRTQNASFHFTDLVLDQRRHGEVVEQLGEAIPDRGVAVLAQAFVVEAVNLRDLPRLVVSPKDGDTVLKPDLTVHERVIIEPSEAQESQLVATSVIVTVCPEFDAAENTEMLTLLQQTVLGLGVHQRVLYHRIEPRTGE